MVRKLPLDPAHRAQRPDDHHGAHELESRLVVLGRLEDGQSEQVKAGVDVLDPMFPYQIHDHVGIKCALVTMVAPQAMMPVMRPMPPEWKNGMGSQTFSPCASETVRE